MRYVRILAESTADDPDAPPYFIDAIIGDDDRILGRHALFGVGGSFKKAEEHFEPFVLYHDGKVDWGTGFDRIPNERYGRFDLRDGPIVIGRLLKFETVNYGTQFYRITQIAELPTKG